MARERHLRLVPPPTGLTWRDREWWDWGGVVGFLLIVFVPGFVAPLTYGILSLLR
jgi:hypothetical protein